MSTKGVNYEELAKAAAEGVARALNAKGGGGSGGGQGHAQEHALQIPQKLIFGGPFIHELFQVQFSGQPGNVTVGQISRAENLQ